MLSLLQKIRKANATLYYCGAAHLSLFLVILVIAQFDHRQLQGINLWMKPAKFALSIGIYCLTWPLFLTYLPDDRIKRRFAAFTVFVMAYEMTVIGGQAAIGQLSHFNHVGFVNTLLSILMGVFISLQTLFAFYMGLRFFKVRNNERDPVMLWAIGLAVIITSTFAFEGGVMAYYFGHNVGVPEGGPGLPFLNWSRLGGDLRVAHFLGLHTLQILPLITYLADIRRKRVVIIIALTYFALVGWLFLQAIHGHPLIAQ